MPIIAGKIDQREKDLFLTYRRLHQGTDGKAIIRGDYKLFREAKKKNLDGKYRLFDLRADPYEENDLATEKPSLVSELTQSLEVIEESCQRSRDGADYAY